MMLFSVLTQSLTFIPLALGISISYNVLRATDMTLDGSFVLGAAVFARLVTLGFPVSISLLCALLTGALAGVMVALIQRGGKVDPLLSGILASFILTSGNLALMGRPNISLLSEPTLFSAAFLHSEQLGWVSVSFYVMVCVIIVALLLRSRFGLTLRALGDNPSLLARLVYSVELYRIAGFSVTNTLAAAAGALTAQVVGYADINMGFGMTLTGIGAIILGRQLLIMLTKCTNLRATGEIIACFIGILIYFFALSLLLRCDINPVYLKMVLGVALIFFLRTALS